MDVLQKYFDSELLNRLLLNLYIIILAPAYLILSIKIFIRLKREGTSGNLIKRVINNWFGLMIPPVLILIILPCVF